MSRVARVDSAVFWRQLDCVIGDGWSLRCCSTPFRSFEPTLLSEATSDTTCIMPPKIKKSSKATKRALVLWTREDKTSIVNLNQVPTAQQFPNAVTTVLFEGDKKWYPAKVILISGK